MGKAFSGKKTTKDKIDSFYQRLLSLSK